MTMSRSEWLAWRRGGLGGTDAAPVCGAEALGEENHVWATPWDVWASLVYGIEEPDDDVKLAGRYFESGVLDWAADEIGEEWVEAEPITGHPLPWVRASPDAYIGDAVIDAKTSGQTWESLPLGIDLQLRFYMAASDRDRAVAAAVNLFRRKLTLYWVERDLKIEKAMLDRMGAWHERYIVGDTPPPIDGSGAARRWLREQHEPTKEWGEPTDDAEGLAIEYAHLGEWIAEHKRRRDAVGNKLRAAIGGSVGIRGDGYRCRWSRFERRKLDMDGLRADHPELLDSYTETVPADRLTVTLQED